MLTTFRREWTSLTAVPALQFGGALHLVAGMSYSQGKCLSNLRKNKTRLHLQPGAAERRSLTPDGHTSHAK